MKIQTLLFIILITNCVYCQEYYTEYTKASFVTQNRDTLHLIDDPLGYSIKKTWEGELPTHAIGDGLGFRSQHSN